MDEKKVIITKAKLTETSTGKPVLKLWAGGANGRLQWPFLDLFDFELLRQVNLRLTDFAHETVQPVTFYAHYTEGRLNSAGNPYRDILYLSLADDSPAQIEDQADVVGLLSAILAELRLLNETLLARPEAAPVEPPPAPGPAAMPDSIPTTPADLLALVSQSGGRYSNAFHLRKALGVTWPPVDRPEDWAKLFEKALHLQGIKIKTDGDPLAAQSMASGHAISKG